MTWSDLLVSIMSPVAATVPIMIVIVYRQVRLEHRMRREIEAVRNAFARQLITSVAPPPVIDRDPDRIPEPVLPVARIHRSKA